MRAQLSVETRVPSKQYTFTYPYQIDKTTKNIQRLRHLSNWAHSPRVNGKLKLRDNPMSRQNYEVTGFYATDITALSLLTNTAPNPVTGWIDTNPAMRRLEASSYSRFRGKLYKGSAALGVTIASWQQSAVMISTRYRHLHELLFTRMAYLSRKLLLRKQLTARDIANTHLEIIFGWMPLFKDIHAAATTIIETRPKLSRVSVRTRTFVHINDTVDRGIGSQLNQGRVELRVTRAATVSVDNPNLWLAERAGLVNPLAVAWDLVPFSFVVNMVLNINSLINSITDFVGLSFPSSSMTKAWRLYGTQIIPQSTFTKGGKATYKSSSKVRTLGGVARPPLTFRIPGMNWFNITMMASLFTQKFRKLLSLLA